MRSLLARWGFAATLAATLIIVAAILFEQPQYANAQTTPPSELRAAIRTALIADPRTASLPQAQLEAIVQILAKQATDRGITVDDIRWRPETETFGAGELPTASRACAGYLCMMSEAFGFTGGDITIPFFLGMSSMGLIWILAEMIHRRRHPILPPPAPFA